MGYLNFEILRTTDHFICSQSKPSGGIMFRAFDGLPEEEEILGASSVGGDGAAATSDSKKKEGLPGWGKFYPRQEQTEGKRFIMDALRAQRSVLYEHGTGSGKTVTLAAVCSELRGLQIFWSTRTHVQAFNLMDHLKKFDGVQAIQVAGRDKLCLHEPVLNSKSGEARGDLCAAACRANECPYGGSSTLPKDPETAHDIEDLIRLCQPAKVCPYYASQRRAKKFGGVVVGTHAMHGKMSGSHSFEVVIHDEAHSYLDATSEEIAVTVPAGVEALAPFLKSNDRYRKKHDPQAVFDALCVASDMQIPEHKVKALWNLLRHHKESATGSVVCCSIGRKLGFQLDPAKRKIVEAGGPLAVLASGTLFPATEEDVKEHAAKICDPPRVIVRNNSKVKVSVSAIAHGKCDYGSNPLRIDYGNPLHFTKLHELDAQAEFLAYFSRSVTPNGTTLALVPSYEKGAALCAALVQKNVTAQTDQTIADAQKKACFDAVSVFVTCSGGVLDEGWNPPISFAGCVVCSPPFLPPRDARIFLTHWTSDLDLVIRRVVQFLGRGVRRPEDSESCRLVLLGPEFMHWGVYLRSYRLRAYMHASEYFADALQM